MYTPILRHIPDSTGMRIAVPPRTGVQCTTRRAFGGDPPALPANPDTHTHTHTFLTLPAGGNVHVYKSQTRLYTCVRSHSCGPTSKGHDGHTLTVPGTHAWGDYARKTCSTSRWLSAVPVHLGLPEASGNEQPHTHNLPHL